MTQGAAAHNRVKSLDGVRGIAILLVVASHVSPRFVPFGGIAGVTLFFVLSGYLITSILVSEHDKTGRIDLRAFYIRRFLRLAPALLALLVFLGVLMAVVGDERSSDYPFHALLAALYVGDIALAGGHPMGLLLHTWSLAIEEQFYLVWPIVLGLLLSRARDRRSLTTVVASAAALAFAYRLVAAIVWGFERVYFAPDTNAFALLLGCALAARSRGRHVLRPNVSLMWVSIAALGAMSVMPLFKTHRLDFLELSAPVTGVFALLLVMIARGVHGGLLSNPLLVWFGKISYGWYLWHVPLIYLQIDGVSNGTARYIAGAVVSLGAAWLSWILLEKRALALKARLESSQANPVLGGSCDGHVGPDSGQGPRATSS